MYALLTYITCIFYLLGNFVEIVLVSKSAPRGAHCGGAENVAIATRRRRRMSQTTFFILMQRRIEEKMSKIDEVRAEMVTAMKNKDKDRKEVLSLLLSALKNVAIDKRADLTEEEENTVVLKEIKQLNELLEQTPSDRKDIIDLCKYRISVLEEFAPKMLTEEEIKAIITEVINGLGITEPKASDKGKIMKELMPKVKGKADGKVVNQIVAEMFK